MLAPKRCGRWTACHAATAASAAATLRWGADALWQQLRAAAARASASRCVARADSTNTRLLERARAERQPDAPITPPGELDARAARRAHAARPPRRRRAALPAGGRAPDAAAAAAWGATGTSGAGASLTFSLALPLAPRGLVGPVAGGRRWRWPRRWTAARRRRARRASA
ncbi:MAG: hypothetical protein MZW92_14345 [Comamonadaceae bacterium]|nr:hypothetical protein [Comamonadaceae bacterium]